MKLTLRQKEYVDAAILAAGILIMLAGRIGPVMLLLVGFLAMLGAVVLHMCWWRCPHCGQFLGRDKGEYCQHCGKKIDYDKKA